MLTFDYDTTYPGPALPRVEVRVRALLAEHQGIVDWALVDSGADGTMIPLAILEDIGARRVDRMRMTGVAGSSQTVDIYEVSVQIGPFTVPKIYAVANGFNQEMLIGRDVLNQFIVTLNGLANSVEIDQ